MKKIWINKSNSFDESDKFDMEYYLKMTPLKRLELMQILREMHFESSKGLKNEISKGLRRVYKIIKQK